ncbi:RNA polymerase sigma factor [Streptomyces sp. JJ38]|uniref:RNA polymerase sigma factor n=1 Tax=Streptomyces sp. JJ38 TaxID=2738128 RepID=UPI001C591F66|nr:sigma-70 family RNA polymerase sigma factor [Streptomyces sp. JJ38]MBW1600385.1 sigma-70 family RNA polymerase sigma factor [Streptomyces sp. JJ38]
MAQDTPPRWDRKMQQRLVRGEAAALGELYDRFASLVYGLAHRVLQDESAAGSVTREVFAHVWEHPDTYRPKEGTMRSWMAGLAQRHAVQQLRRRHREADAPEEQLEQQVRAASAAARADYIVTAMPTSLRAALELAHRERRTYREAARDLGVTEDEARRRLRLGLQLLSTATPATPATPPPHGSAGRGGEL